MTMIGIDLGITNSLVCVYREGKTELIPNELGEYKTKSAVSLMEDGTILVGAAAKERLITHPETTAASFKVWMGTDRAITLGMRKFKPEELSAFVLKQLLSDARRYLGEPVEEAIISVPAYFNDNQRCATKLAAKLAGLKVQRLINEPSAAALYQRHSTGNDDCQMMIIDFGGGTLDVSLVECFENIIEITAISGDNHLGGDDIDLAIADYFCAQNQIEKTDMEPSTLSALFRQAEAAKIALSDAQATVISLKHDGKPYQMTLTQDTLRRLCEPLFYRVREVISRAMKNRMRQGRIDQVVLVGGSSRLKVFGDFLEELFGRRPFVAAKPDEIVALGVGLSAGIKNRAEDLQDLVMTDVCPFSLGVATYNSIHDKKPHMAVLIQRSSLLPASHQSSFCTLSNNQESIRFEIYQGEGYYASENLKLGEITIPVPPGPAGHESAMVTFTYDIDGILHVSVRSSGGDYRDRLLLNSRLNLTEMEMKQAMKRITQIQLAAQGTQEDRFLLEKALSLYQMASGKTRELLSSIISCHRMLIDDGDLIELKKHRTYLRQRLGLLEEYLYADPLENGLWLSLEEEDNEDGALV